MYTQKANNGTRKSKNRGNKLHLVFDETQRKEFLTGFHKRKLQRKKEAREKFDKELKEERKRLKSEAKESYKKLVVSHRVIPELEHLFENKCEDEDVTVRVVQLSTNDIAKQNHWIGANQPKEEEEEDELEEEQEEDEEQQLPGMELKTRRIKSKSQGKAEAANANMFHNKRDIKKVLKKQATTNVQKSKVFQLKNKMERQKQKRKSLKLRRGLERQGKKKNKQNKSRK